MKIFGISHIGNSRTNQEDNFLIGDECLSLDAIRRFSTEFPSVGVECADGSDDTLLAVSDGMGGHSAGEIASYMAVDCLADRRKNCPLKDEADLQRAIAEVNRGVYAHAQNNPNCRGMGATLCGFIRHAGRLLGFNVGDSRLYRFEEGSLLQLSRDHSEGQRLLDLKLLTPEELKTFPNRKAIYRFIGMKEDLIADVFEIAPCGPGTILLLCTDGLADVLSNYEIREILQSDNPLREKGEKMLNVALERNIGHGDNITIIVAEF